MAESKETPEYPSSAHEQLSPGEVANFPGSLVVNNLSEPPNRRATPKEKAGIADWVFYFREGWDDVGIWKSAVSMVGMTNVV